MENVFNVRALTVGCLLLPLCLIVQAAGAHFVSLRLKPLMGRLESRHKHGVAQLIFLLSAFILLASHLIQIYLWGQALYLAGAETNLHRALVFAGSTYTTVGFADDPLTLGWQLVTIIMATSGLFSFGWSTSVMFMLAQTLYPSQR